MKYSRLQLSLLLAGNLGIAQKVVQGSVQHFQARNTGAWQPLLRLGFGTPAQEITGIFDTGSSDTIIPLAGSSVCRVQNQQCTAPAPIVRGQFDPKQASDFEPLPGQVFNASFGGAGGGDNYRGNMIKTTVTVADEVRVPNAEVALANAGQPAGIYPQFAIFGVGPQNIETTTNKYDNLPLAMKHAGVIKSNSFSVVMNPTPLANGSVFFGGVDRSKFEGELQQVPIERTGQGRIVEFVVKMTSLALDMGGGTLEAMPINRQRREHMRLKPFIHGRRAHAGVTAESGERRKNGNSVSGGDRRDGQDATDGNNGQGSAAGNSTSHNLVDLGLTEEEADTLFDTGGGQIRLPPHVVEHMSKALGASFNASGMGPVECGKLNPGSRLVMGFNGGNVTVTLGLDKLRLSEELTNPRLTEAGLCDVGVDMTSDGGLNTMAFTWFTDVFTVFDLENNSLWFAQAKGDPGAPGCELEEFP